MDNFKDFKSVDLTNFKSRKPTPLQNNPLPPSTPTQIGQPPIYPVNPSFRSPQSQKSTSSKPQTQEKTSLLPDFSTGDVVHNDFYKRDYAYRVNKELKSKGFSSATTRNVIADMLKDKSNRGLNRKEVRQGLDNLVDKGKITPSQAKYFRKITKIY